MKPQINLKTKTFQELLNEKIKDFSSKIIAIYHVGSSLYIKNFNDIDLVAIVKEPFSSKVKFEYKDKKVNIMFQSQKKFESKRSINVISRTDVICIWGDDVVERYDFLQDKELCEFLDKKFDEVIKREPKRKWQKLLFVCKIQNGSHKLTDEQLQELNNIHDLRGNNNESETN